MRRWHGLIVVMIAAVLCVWPARVMASTISVNDAAGFQRAAATLRVTGGRIVLLRHLYAKALVVGPRSARPLTIVGATGARVREFYLDHTRAVHVAHVVVVSMAADGGVWARHSRGITFSHVLFTAAGTRHNMEVNLDHSMYVAVRDSSFSHCGDLTPEVSRCLRPFWADYVTISGNRFHDCRGCDFVHGRAGRHLVIKDNTFDRALACHQWSFTKCVHQDMIELFAASGLWITGNRFGVTQRGAAQVFLNLRVNYARIVNNLFIRDDPVAPGIESPVGIRVGGNPTVLPSYVQILNNTILSGRRLSSHPPTSIALSLRYLTIPKARRPLIANNALARAEAPRLGCEMARASIRNAAMRGAACSETDAVGPLYLSPNYRPTAVSTLLIDRAYPGLAPPTDRDGIARGPHPDIGCYEFH